MSDTNHQMEPMLLADEKYSQVLLLVIHLSWGSGSGRLLTKSLYFGSRESGPLTIRTSLTSNKHRDG